MSLLKNLIIHVSATPYGRVVTPNDLTFWHMFPKNNGNGTYTYLGKTYKSVNAIPNDSYNINGKVLKVRDYPNNGRGWSVEGYADFIDVVGELHNIVPYDFDSVIDPWEITNGVAGANSMSRHICLAGGGSKKDPKKTSAIMPVDEVLNDRQIQALIAYIRFQREMYPNIRIAGHNEFAAKTCPNFSVPKFLIDYEV